MGCANSNPESQLSQQDNFSMKKSSKMGKSGNKVKMEERGWNNHEVGAIIAYHNSKLSKRTNASKKTKESEYRLSKKKTGDSLSKRKKKRKIKEDNSISIDIEAYFAVSEDENMPDIDMNEISLIESHDMQKVTLPDF